jgi:RNA polymerase sigma-70 factor (ECF subfamily)
VIRHTNPPMTPIFPSDRDLVARLLRADRQAFDQFFNEYYPKLYRFAKRRAPHDPSGAEDVAQATLCRALASLAGFRGEASLFTWLCTLCRREMSARWRDTRGFTTAASLAEDDPEVRGALESLLSADSADPLLSTGREQLRENIRIALDYLPAPYADVLEWKYLQDKNVADIAAQLGRSVKATESLLTRARQAFREAFSLLQGDTVAGVSS